MLFDRLLYVVSINERQQNVCNHGLALFKKAYTYDMAYEVHLLFY
jgi:hypothetical protein